VPGRFTPLINEGVYHVFNRAITDLTVFQNRRDYIRAMETISFYRFSKFSHRFSYYIRLSQTKKDEITNYQSPHQLVDILSYCLMPNHFHFLIRQNQEFGIQKFISQFSNSYTRYFNTKRHRVGPIFQGTFKSVEIESQEQLIHVSRYIHLNPYSSGLVKKYSDLVNYQYSSYEEFIHPSNFHICNVDTILSLFSGPEEYARFVSDQSDYQRQLEIVKHLLFDP